MREIWCLLSFWRLQPGQVFAHELLSCRMTSFLKKFQILKRKSAEAHDSIPEEHRVQPDPREATRNLNRQQPSTSTQDPAFQRTSQILPLLVKPVQQSNYEPKKKAQAQPLTFPELPNPNNPNRGEQSHRSSVESSRQQVSLPKVPAAKAKKSSPVLKKKGDSGSPILPGNWLQVGFWPHPAGHFLWWARCGYRAIVWETPDLQTQSISVYILLS